MKILLLFPPQWTPISPHFAIPSLMGQLKKENFDVEAMDLNIDFYNEILTNNFVSNSIKKADELFPQLLKDISKHHSPEKQFTDYPADVQGFMIKYSKIKEYKQNKTYQLENIPKVIEDAVKTLKSKESFYNPESCIKALNIIDTALEIVSLPFFPAKLSMDSYTNALLKLNHDSIKHYVFDKNTNMFWDYYKNIINSIKEKKADYIGISINSSTQIIPGLTLAYLLKTSTTAHINIGGNFFGRVVENIEYQPEFFELYCHSLLVEEGEKPVIQLARYLNGEIGIESVSNLVYAKENKVIINKKETPLKLDEMANADLDGFDLEKYFAPETVMPFQSSKGCYWGKCSFCDQDFGQNFNIKNIDKLTEEIKEIKEKYGISNFEFIDESISPAYFDEMSQKILDKDIKINYFSNARLESSFTPEILKKARQSGLRMLLWGLESGSEKIMELINKGIDLEKRFDILKASSDADIWNFAFMFFGFPSETQEDAKMTIKMLCENNDIINSYGRSTFTMGKHTKLRENPAHYGIIGVTEQQDEYSPTFDFEAAGMTKKELSDIIKLCTQECNKAYHNPLWMYLKYREYLFLYIAKHGVKWVQDYKLNL